jgi:hypothetical protein
VKSVDSESDSLVAVLGNPTVLLDEERSSIEPEADDPASVFRWSSKDGREVLLVVLLAVGMSSSFGSGPRSRTAHLQLMRLARALALRPLSELLVDVWYIGRREESR